MAETYKVITEVPGWLQRLENPDAVSSDGACASSYSRVPLVFRAVRLRADSICAIPVRIVPIRGRATKQWPFPEPLDYLLWRASASLDLAGAAYWEKVANAAGVVKNVKYRNPFDMMVEYREGVYKFRQKSTSAQWVNVPDEGEYDVVYFTEYDPLQDITPGVGAAQVALQNSRLLHYMTKFAAAFFEGGAMPVTLLGIDTHDRAEVAKAENWFRRATTGVAKAFRVLGVRAQSIQPQILTPPIKDLIIPELEEKARHEVSMAFGIPVTMLEDAANFATASEHRLSFWEDTIKPRAMLLASVINSQLMAPLGLRLEFDMEALPVFQEDENTRSERFARLVSAGVPLGLAGAMAGYPEDIVASLGAAQAAQSQTEQEKEGAMGEIEPGNAEMRNWQRKALKRMRDGKSLEFPWDCRSIPAWMEQDIKEELKGCRTEDEVRAVFRSARGVESSLAEELKRANDLLAIEGTAKAQQVQTAAVSIPSIVVNVPPESFKMETPSVIVNVPAPVVNVEVSPAEQPAPIVNVQPPEVQVTVEVPTVDVTVTPNLTLPESEPVSLTVTRDKNGRISGVNSN